MTGTRSLEWKKNNKNKKKKSNNNNSSAPTLASDIFLPSVQEANAQDSKLHSIQFYFTRDIDASHLTGKVLGSTSHKNRACSSKERLLRVSLAVA
jgi:hypothetical protein